MTATAPSLQSDPIFAARPALWLFDIDGTLLISGGAGQHAMLRTLEREFEIDSVDGDIPAAGRTDFAITSDLFEQFGIESTEAVRERFRETYLTHLRDVLAERRGRLLAGVVPLLERLGQIDGCHLALLTGNYYDAALAKLEAFEIASHFAADADGRLVGGFGDDFAARNDVAAVAFEAAETHFDTVDRDATFVIGDTPSDVRCGRAIGARTIAVATGMFSRSELAAAEPDFLVDSLDDLLDERDSS